MMNGDELNLAHWLLLEHAEIWFLTAPTGPRHLVAWRAGGERSAFGGALAAGKQRGDHQAQASERGFHGNGLHPINRAKSPQRFF
jgi:hypothetical protein